MGDSKATNSGQKAQAILVSGFLGAGKTTLLQWILSWPADLSDTVVMVNEFGDAGIDASLLNSLGSDIIELSSGCICCTLSADFRQSLKRVWKRFHPRHILIEASGVADPTVIASVFHDPDIRECMSLERIVTVLDADFWEAREAFGPLFYNQLEAAHLILLNKIDLLEEEKIPRFLTEIRHNMPHSWLIPTVRCRIDPETLWMEQTPETGNMPSTPACLPGAAPLSSPETVIPGADGHGKEVPHHEHFSDHQDYVTFSFKERRPLKEECLHHFLDQLPWRVFRVKGPVRLEDRTILLNFAGGKSECRPWQNSAETHLVFIAWSVHPEDILERLRGCILSS